MAVRRSRVLVISAAGVIAGLLVIELAARLIGRPASLPDPTFSQAPEWGYPNRIAKDAEVFWRFRPNQVIRDGFFAPGRYSINAHGFRGPECGEEKPAGVMRVVCLGGSTTFGWGVSDGMAYPRQLEYNLNRLDPQGRQWQVINAGITNYSTHQGLALARRRLAQWKPDIVLFSFSWGDHQRAGRDIPDKNLQLPPQWRLTLENVIIRSAAVQWAKKVLWGAFERSEGADAVSPVVWRVNPTDFNANIERLIRLAKEAGARPIWVTSPISWPPPGANDTSGIFNYHHEYQDVARYATHAAGGAVAELANVFNLYPEFYNNPAQDIEHFNEAGHSFAGEFLARFILGLPPPERKPTVPIPQGQK